MEDINWIVPYIGRTYRAEGLKTFFKQYSKQDTCKGKFDSGYMDCMYQKLNCGLEEVIKYHK